MTSFWPAENRSYQLSYCCSRDVSRAILRAFPVSPFRVLTANCIRRAYHFKELRAVNEGKTKMWIKARKLLVGFGIGTALLLAGCQSSTKPTASDASGTAPSQAVTCDKCKVTWIKVPTEGGKGRVVGYTNVKQMECPMCKDAAANFFETGKLEHICSVCGGNMSICEAH